SQDRSRQILVLLLALGDAQRLTHAQLAEAVETYQEAAELAGAEGSPTDLARAALGLQETGIWIGRPAHDSVGLLEAALACSGSADSPDRSRLLAALAMALFSLGDSHRVSALLAEAAQVARRCGDRQALYGALVRQNTVEIGYGCPASRFAERRRILDEIAPFAEETYETGTHLLWGFGPAAAYLEMGDYESFAATLAQFREYSSKHRISTF